MATCPCTHALRVPCTFATVNATIFKLFILKRIPAVCRLWKKWHMVRHTRGTVAGIREVLGSQQWKMLRGHMTDNILEKKPEVMTTEYNSRKQQKTVMFRIGKWGSCSFHFSSRWAQAWAGPATYAANVFHSSWGVHFGTFTLGPKTGHTLLDFSCSALQGIKNIKGENPLLVIVFWQPERATVTVPKQWQHLFVFNHCSTDIFLPSCFDHPCLEFHPVLQEPGVWKWFLYSQL